MRLRGCAEAGSQRAGRSRTPGVWGTARRPWAGVCSTPPWGPLPVGVSATAVGWEAGLACAGRGQGAEDVVVRLVDAATGRKAAGTRGRAQIGAAGAWFGAHWLCRRRGCGRLGAAGTAGEAECKRVTDNLTRLRARVRRGRRECDRAACERRTLDGGETDGPRSLSAQVGGGGGGWRPRLRAVSVGGQGVTTCVG